MKIISDPKAPYHEAGHALVAKRLKIPLRGVGFVDRHPPGEGGLGTGVVNESDLQNPVFSAGGMAAEEILFGAYDPEGSESDRASIVEEGLCRREHKGGKTALES